MLILASTRLHLGCGNKIIPGWVNVDGVPGPGVEHVPDVRDWLGQLPDASLEACYSGHFIEHLPPNLLPAALAHLHRALKPGGKLTLATISLEGIFHNAFEKGYSREAVNAYLYGDCKSTDSPFMAHRQVFTGAWLTEYLKAAGFSVVRQWSLDEYPEIKALNDCAASSYHVTLYLEGLK